MIYNLFQQWGFHWVQINFFISIKSNGLITNNLQALLYGIASTLPAVKWVKNWRTFDWYVVNFTFDIVILVLEKFYVKLFNWWHIKLLQFQLYYHSLPSNQFMTWICQWIKSNWSNTKLIFMLLIEANVITLSIEIHRLLFICLYFFSFTKWKNGLNMQ